MGKLHLIGGEKGGVGKSFLSRLLAQYIIDRRESLIGFDSDCSHATFSRFYEEFTTALNSKEESGFDPIIEAAEENPDANILVDLAAQTNATLQEWMQGCDLGELMQELGYQIVYWHVMDDGADSVKLLQQMIDSFAGTAVQLIAVQNYGRGKSFRQFEKSPAAVIARQSGAKFFLMARLQEDLTQKIDFSDASFWAAGHDHQTMKTVERHRMKVWLKFNYDQLNRILDNVAAPINTQLANELDTISQQA